MLSPRFIILAAALLAAAQTAAAVTSQTANLTLAGLTCTGHAFTGLSAKYSYNLTLTSISVPSGCSDSNIRISKLYVDGACASQRDNSFALLRPQDISCSDKVSSADDSAICADVLGSSSGNWASANLVTPGTSSAANVDSDNICATSGKDGFVFIQNNCTQAITADITFTTGDYSGGTCVLVAGHALSKGVIIALVIAAIVVLIILGVLIKCCCCCL